jgi:hypothetical protein
MGEQAHTPGPLDLEILRYAERNHGRDFVTPLVGEPHNEAINRLTDLGLFVDGGPSASGRWRVLTDAGRAAIAKAEGRS